jgi:hypothetical protein
MGKLKRKSVVTFLAILALALSGTSWLAQQVAALGKGAYENVEAFANVLTLVQKHYVDDVTTKQLIDGAINGMLVSLDAHSAYLTPDLYKELQVDTRGSFGGLDRNYARNGILTVVSPIEYAGISFGRAARRSDHQDREDTRARRYRSGEAHAWTERDQDRSHHPARGRARLDRADADPRGDPHSQRQVPHAR